MARAGGRGQVPLSQHLVEKCPALGKEGGQRAWGGRWPEPPSHTSAAPEQCQPTEGEEGLVVCLEGRRGEQGRSGMGLGRP